MHQDSGTNGEAAHGAIPQSAAIAGLPAGELAARIARGELSAAEAVEAHIARIVSTAARINAVCHPLFDEAREQAWAADTARARGEALGRLHGVPVTVKDFFDVAGAPTTAGLTARAKHRAAADAAAVARLRQAGAIIIAKTNVSQLGFFYESDNPLHGLTRNPWHPGRSPGGSSGGEAAVIACGGSPLGLGSDGGGSIRQPAHASGICGLKPTAGRLPLRGHFHPPNWLDEWLQPGPMARSVADLALAMEVLAAPGEADGGPEAPAQPLRDPAAVSLRGLRAGFYTDDGFFPAAPALRRAVMEAAGALEKAGLEVEEFRPPGVERAFALYITLFLADGLAAVRRHLRGSKPDRMLRWMVLQAAVPGFLRVLGSRVLGWLGRTYEANLGRAACRRILPEADRRRLLERQEEYRRMFLAAMDARRLDVLIAPPHGLPALVHGCYHGGFTGSYALLFNFLGWPAGVIPATRVRSGEESDRPASRDPVAREAKRVEAGSAGLPVGVQVAARPWREDLVLAAMAALEARFRERPDHPGVPILPGPETSRPRRPGGR